MEVQNNEGAKKQTRSRDKAGEYVAETGSRISNIFYMLVIIWVGMDLVDIIYDLAYDFYTNIANKSELLKWVPCVSAVYVLNNVSWNVWELLCTWKKNWLIFCRKSWLNFYFDGNINVSFSHWFWMFLCSILFNFVQVCSILFNFDFGQF